MDIVDSEEPLLPNSSTILSNEETPLDDNQEETFPIIIPEVYDWNTSLISQFCRDGDIPRIRLFIEFSAQMSSCAKFAAEITDRLDSETGLSPLHHAARYQQLHICLMLLSNINLINGANIKDVDGRTPIHSALRLSNRVLSTEDQFRIDVDFGNKIQESDVWRDEYTKIIRTCDHPLIYLFAKANGNLNAQDKYLLTPLHYAVIRNNLPGVKQLIKLNADIEPRDRQGIRPLHLACKEGFVSIAEYLIEQGADIDAIDDDDWTIVHYACSKGQLDIVKLINSFDKNHFQNLLTMKTINDSTCLHLAVQTGNIELVEHILNEYKKQDLKLFINEQTEPFGTALHIAAKFCDPSMIELLYHHGADPLILNSNNQSPLHIACELNRLLIVEAFYKLTQTLLLEIKDDHDRTALSVTTNPDIVDALISFNCDVSSLDKNHMNALMIAVSNNEISVVNHLLSAIDSKLLPILDQTEKRNGRSIFLIAVETGSVEMCSLLLTNSNIRWDTVDKKHMNAIHIAAKNNHYELIKYLCEYIENNENRQICLTQIIDHSETKLQKTSSILHLYINAQNEDGKTPLHLASERGYLFCIETLINYGANVLLANHLNQLPLEGAIQNGHSQCVAYLIKNCQTYSSEFETVLAKRQSPLITACQNGFVDIVEILIKENIGLDCGMDYDSHDEENPLEVAIKYRQTAIVNTLLEHPHYEYWLRSIRDNGQTPLRDIIRYMPQCARHAFDKLISKEEEIGLNGNKLERTTYKYKYIDDYFGNNGELYTKKKHKLYRNHPLIIALDNERHFLLDHPLAKQLMTRKWKLYRPMFHLSRTLIFLLLFLTTCYGLKSSAPIPNLSTKEYFSFSKRIDFIMHLFIIILSSIQILKIIFEIILYRGLRVPFAQLFGLMTFTISIIAFIPNTEQMTSIIHWKWELASFSILLQWFNVAVILRSVPFVGKFIVLIESILIKFTLVIVSVFPLFIAFAVSTKMFFSSQPSFETLLKASRKSSVMLIGEFDYEKLFSSQTTFSAASLIFVPFIGIMTIVFMNTILGITVGDIKLSMENARAKANAYWIRDLIYLESTLPNKNLLKSNIVEEEVEEKNVNDQIQKQIDQENENIDESTMNKPYAIELYKLLEILEMLSTQAKQILQYEIDLEQTLKQLLKAKNTQDSQQSTSDRLLSVQ